MAPSHYLNQWWNIVNWSLRIKLQWNFNHNWNSFIQEKAFKNFVWTMAVILSWPLCVNTHGTQWIIAVEVGQYHGCWCPGFLHCQVIISKDNNYAGQTGPCLWWEAISTNCSILGLKNIFYPLHAKFFLGNIKCFYNSVVPHTNMTQVVEILPCVRKVLTYST